MMPVMGGNEFLERLLHDYADTWAKIPVLAVTAKGNGTSPNLMPTVAGWLAKPLDIDELLKLVSKYCGQPG